MAPIDPTLVVAGPISIPTPLDAVEASVAALDAGLPLALFPVRLETRLYPSATGGPTELRVRIYPEPITVDGANPALSPSEQTAGKAFWSGIWKALAAGLNGGAYTVLALDTILKANTDLWAALADTAGSPGRALLVATTLWPSNLKTGTALPASPVWPAFTTRAEGQDAPPVARLLPDRWVVTAYWLGNRVAARVASRVVPSDLPCGPALFPATAPALGTDPLPTALLKAAGAHWMIDFDAAEAAGMAVRLSIDAGLSGVSLDVHVWGVRSSAAPDAAAKEVEKLLAAHAGSQGASFLATGTATNNTDSQRTSSAASDPGPVASMLGPATTRAGTTDTFTATSAFAQSRARNLVRALGLSPGSMLFRLDGAESDTVTNDADRARAANVVLWYGTWNAFFTQVLAHKSGTTVTGPLADVTWLHDWFVTQVRAQGPLPTLRVGAHPYGFLPVLRRRTFSSPSGAEQILSNLLGDLRDALITPAWASIPRLDPTLQNTTTDPAQPASPLVRILSRSPDPEQFLMLQQASYTLLPLAPPAQYQAALDALMTAASTTVKPQVTAADAQTTLDGQINAFTKLKTSQPTLATAIGKVLDQLQAYKKSLDVLTDLPTVSSKLSLRLSSTPPYPMLSGVYLPPFPFDRPPLVGTGAGTWIGAFADVLRSGKAAPAAPSNTPLLFSLVKKAVKDVTASDKTSLIAALDILKGMSDTDLHRLAAATLGLAAHRLDAWVTSRATSRLATLRAAKPTGVIVGGFGWVEGLKAGVSSVGPSQGFMLAPSLAHAATASVLRSGYSVHGEVKGQSPFAVDLSSRRVRAAQAIFAGVRQGLDLSEILGARFERRLHEAGADRFVQPIRDAVRTAVATSETPSSGRVVDGLVLGRAMSSIDDREVAEVAAATAVTRAVNALSPTAAEQAALSAAYKDLAEVLDAIADAGLAESLYQLASGNPSGVAATTDTIDRGEAPPPALRVADSPRTGIPVQHRLVILLGSSTGAWSATGRGAALPALEAWVGRLLGPAASVPFVVSFTDASGITQPPVTRTLADAAISALDLVCLAPPAGCIDGSALAAALTVGLTAPAGTTAKITGAALDDLLVVAREVRRMLREGRPLLTSDLLPPESSAPAATDAATVSAWQSFLDGASDWASGLASGGSALLQPGPAPAGFDDMLQHTADRASGSALRGWLAQAARVRAGAGALWEALSLAEALAGSARADLRIAQLPDVRDGAGHVEAWAGLHSPPGPRLSLLCCQSPAQALGTAPVQGILVDQWAEACPRAAEQGGVALHFDSPGARGPQAVVLGVADERGWSTDAIDEMVQEVKSLVRARATPIGWPSPTRFLPAIFTDA